MSWGGGGDNHCKNWGHMGLYMIVICTICIDFLFLFAAAFVCVTSIGGISGLQYLIGGGGVGGILCVT